MNKGWFYPIIALVMATMACQTILDPITKSADLEPETLLEPIEPDLFEELDPDSLLEPDSIVPPDDISGGDVLMQDDFNDPSSGWEVGDFDSGSVGYASDSYSVISLGESDAMWGLAYRDFEDVVIEVETKQVRAPDNDNNAYGVMCRVQENDDGYLLRISGDGFFSISKWVSDEFITLVDWTTSDVIQMGNSTNQIRVICDGSTLTMEVNGQQMASVEDLQFARGDIALTATSFEADPTEIHFDNLVVTAP